jgi:hypothetical protein
MERNHNRLGYDADGALQGAVLVSSQKFAGGLCLSEFRSCRSFVIYNKNIFHSNLSTHCSHAVFCHPEYSPNADKRRLEPAKTR